MRVGAFAPSQRDIARKIINRLNLLIIDGMEKVTFTLKSTEASKGIALVLLLWHHLFCYKQYGTIIYGTAIMARVCIPMFLILSGYGLTESIKNNISLLNFYKKRLSNIYANYWLINLLFVPVGVVFFNRSLQNVFESYPYIKYATQLTGLHRYFYSEYGVNPTWYYLSVIIPLVILYPFIYVLVRKFRGYFLAFTLLIAIGSPIVQIVQLQFYLLPFVLGVYLSCTNGFCCAKSFYSQFGRGRRYLVLIGVMTIVVAFRCSIPFMFSTSIYHRLLAIADPVLGFMIISLVFEMTQDIRLLEKLLSFLGRHLFNIFLFHTFIYLYYWNTFVYSFGNSLIILFVFLVICLLISMLIEKTKNIIGFYKLLVRIDKFNLSLPFNHKTTIDFIDKPDIFDAKK